MNSATVLFLDKSLEDRFRAEVEEAGARTVAGPQLENFDSPSKASAFRASMIARSRSGLSGWPAPMSCSMQMGCE